MAHVQRKGTKWQARYRDAGGKEHARRFTRKVDADDWLVTKQADLLRGTYIDPAAGKVTFAQWVEHYRATTTKRATTAARDGAVLRAWLLPALGDLPLSAITPMHVTSLVKTMTARLAPASVRTHYGVLRAILTAAVDADVIARNPCRKVRMPEARREPKRLASADDVQRLAAAMPADYRPAVFLGALGLRQAEVFGLRVGAVDFLRRTVTVRETVNEVEGRFVTGGGKTGASVRTISVPQPVIDILAEHLARTGRNAPGDLVVQSPNGGPVRAGAFRARVYNPALVATRLEGLTFSTVSATLPGT